MSPNPITLLARKVLTAERPLFLIGHGMRIAGAKELFINTVRTFEIPYLVTSHGKGSVPEDNPFFVGVLGFGAAPETELQVQNMKPDLVVAMGTRLGETSTSGWTESISEGTELYHILNDANDFSDAYPSAERLTADLRAVLREIWKESGKPVPASVPAVHQYRINEAKFSVLRENTTSPLNPKDVVTGLEMVMPNDSLLVADIGNSMAWVIRHMKFQRGQEFYVPMGLGSMGSGVGSAIGAKLAQPRRPVFCLTGDCALLMYGSEILTARENNVGVVFLVMNDGGHGMVDHGHRLLNLPGVQVRFQQAVDFKSWANAFGVEGHSVNSMSEFAQLPWEKWAQGLNQPVVVDLRIDTQIEPPIKARIRILGAMTKIGH